MVLLEQKKFFVPTEKQILKCLYSVPHNYEYHYAKEKPFMKAAAPIKRQVPKTTLLKINKVYFV